MDSPVENDVKVKSMNIYARLLAAQEELHNMGLKKDIKVKTQKQEYWAFSDAAIFNAVAKVEAKYGLYGYVASSSMETLPSSDAEQRVRMSGAYVVINVDNPEEKISCPIYGDGFDYGDKAIGKATTYALKNVLKMLYLISVGDDPDRKASPDEPVMPPKPDNGPVSAAQIAMLQKQCEKDGIDINDILQLCSVDRVEDLDKIQFSNLCKEWSSKVIPMVKAQADEKVEPGT